jgi:hypothetical protein
MPDRIADYIWTPQTGPQHAFLDCPHPEVFFGGARGGGKTDGVLGKWMFEERKWGQHFNAIMFRQTTVSAEDAVERSKEIYGPIGGKYREDRLRWRLPNGGRVSFAYLENVSDAQQYQGRNVTHAWVEEAGNYADPTPIDRLFGVLRSAHGVPIQLVLTGNPGGPGQHWIRDRYQLHPFPAKPKTLLRALDNGKSHKVAVIPSRITDNKVLLRGDPGYIDRLYMVGSAALVRAWLEGDWSAVEGAFFDCWSEAQHVIVPFAIPSGWLRFRSGDWGSYSPFCFGWYAVAQDDFTFDEGCVIPRGALVKYREWYGSTNPGGSGKGLKLTAEAVATGLISRERDDPKLSYGVLDPSTFKEDGGPSVGERINDTLLARKLAPFHEADNRRVPATDGKDRRGPMSGWDQLRGRLIGTARQSKGVVNWYTGRPMIYFFSTCTASIRTIPVLQHDPKKAEDLDTNSEDHAADETRYACMSRPWIKKAPAKEPFSADYKYGPTREMGNMDAWKVDYEESGMDFNDPYKGQRSGL